MLVRQPERPSQWERDKECVKLMETVLQKSTECALICI